MSEIVTLKGPLDEQQLRWVTELYGPVDQKYASLEYVRHQLVENSFGWSVHAFVLDGGRAAGHCCAVPFRARLGDEVLVAGKIEAVVLAEDQRGRRTSDGRSLAVAMLTAMYDAAHEHGLALLFGLAPPPVAAVHARAGCERVRLDDPTYVFVATPSAVDAKGARALAFRLLAAGQRAVLGVASCAVAVAGGARVRVTVDSVRRDDAELAVTAPTRTGAWTISGAEAWSWYAGSGLLHAVETRGRFGSRALVRLVDAPGADVQIVAWSASGLSAAVLLLAALARLARQRGARTLRFQPWAGAAGNGALARACRLLGFVRRTETELVLHAQTPELAAAGVELTPFFYVTF